MARRNDGCCMSCSSVKPQSHTSSLGSGVELSERTTSSKVRSETVDSILSAVAKKKVVTSDKGQIGGISLFLELQAQPANSPVTSKPPQFRCAVPWSLTDSNSVNTTKHTHSQQLCAAPNNWCALSSQSTRSERSIEDQLAIEWIWCGTISRGLHLERVS